MSFDDYLAHVLDDVTSSRVKEAMQYSLMNGGKRVRPKLLMNILEGYDVNPASGFACAAGIEMIHSYSLIHDDLPAMDNDTLRRGKPTCHIAFDEATAILAGDGLLTHAFLQAALATCDYKKNNEIVKYFVHCAGCDGMVLGQTLDLQGEQKADMDIKELKRIHYYKTGQLLTLPMICAAIIANHSEDIQVWKKVGEYIGLSFQIQDDLFDVTSTKEELGKDINSDAQNHKSTYATLMDIEEANNLCEEYFQEAKELVKQLAFDHEGLFQLFDALRERKN